MNWIQSFVIHFLSSSIHFTISIPFFDCSHTWTCQTNILANVYVAVFVIVSQQLILKALSAVIALIVNEPQVLTLLQ